MTTSELIRRVRSSYDELLGGLYQKTTTTSAGNAGGTTFVSTNVTGVDDFINQKELVIASGDANGQRREISDWDNGTNTGTLLTTAGFLIASGIDIEIGEKGFWSDREILDWANDGNNDAINRLTNKALADTHDTVDTTAGLLGVANFPSDYIRLADQGQGKFVLIDGAVTPIIDPGQYQRFVDDTFTPTSLGRGIAMLRNGEVHYRPANNATITWHYIKEGAEIDIDNAPDIPAEIHHALVDYIVYRGLLKNESSLAIEYFNKYENKLNTYNLHFE
jgi:hypothetical protein